MLNVVTGYGAVGNYNPSAGTGTDDTVAFQNALAAAQSTGQMLYIPAGNYKITGTIGSSSWPAGTGARMFGDGCFASNLYMIGTQTGNPGGATLLLSGQNSLMRDVGVVGQYNTTNMVQLGPKPSTAESYIQISNCRFTVNAETDSYEAAIYCNTITGSTIDQCVFVGFPYIGPTRQWIGTGIQFIESQNCTVTNCKMEYLNYGVYTSGNTNPGVQGILISSNVMFGLSTAISVQGNTPSGTAAAYVSLVNNILDYCAIGGIYADQSTAAITSNYIAVDQSTSKGVAGVFLSNCINISIVGNSFVEYSGPTGQVTAIALTETCVFCVVNSNTTSYFNTGILLSSACENCVVTSNAGLSTYGAFISNGSTSTSLNNNVS